MGSSAYPVVTPALLRDWPLPDPHPGGDKHDRGRVLVVGGSAATPGAVLLAGVAALRCGAGTLQLASVATVAAALGVAVPEALVRGLPASAAGELDPTAAAAGLREAVSTADALLVGPGMSDAESTTALLTRLLPAVGRCTTVVLDALALRCVGTDPTLCRPVADRLVVTPNLRELAELAGVSDRTVPGEVPEVARQVAGSLRAVVAARGFVAAPDGRGWLPQLGGAGLGTSGSGDVLAGLVVGLAARGAELAQAAVWAGHVHAVAGQRLAARVGPLGYLARELLEEVPRAFVELWSVDRGDAQRSQGTGAFPQAEG